MEVNLDQIEFYHGPNRPSAKDVPSNHASTHASRYLQQTFSTGLGFRPRQCEVSLGQSPPMTGPTHEWNIFDFEINHVYEPIQSEMKKEVEPAVARELPAATVSSLDRGSFLPGFSEPAPPTDSARTNLCPAKPGHLDIVSHDMPGYNLPGKLTHHDDEGLPLSLIV